VAVIGAGPAGLAAAISAKENGGKNIIIFDRNNWLGGILPQCIHDGFGVEETGSSMTGPEYADDYIKKVEKLNIELIKETMVLSFNKNLEITYANKEGIHKIKAKSIVLAMGCREKTRWNIMIPGDRPSGIYTAGATQAFINLYNIMPGKKVVILGSGDVGLIMARRLKFEGAEILGVIEILPYASGLPRNVVQCLDDYNIPLYLNHTITNIEGRNRLEKVIVSKIDKNSLPIPGTDKTLFCDTLLLSLGLIPENELSIEAGIVIDSITKGPVVNQFFETNLSGVYACGNCLQVYDTVDLLSLDAKIAGRHAAGDIDKKESVEKKINIVAGDGIKYVIPQTINEAGDVFFTMRVEKPGKPTKLRICTNKNEIFNKKLHWINPANMIRLKVKISDEVIKSSNELEVKLDN